MKVRLSVQHRKANVKTVVLHSDAVIGRSTECNLRLASGQVSRKHCQLFIDEFRVAVMDLGSSNGTFLNGDPLEANVEVPLPPGAELEIGPVRFTVEYDDPSADTSIRRTPAASAEAEAEPPDIAVQTPPQEPPPEAPRRPLLVAKAARKKTEPTPEGDPLADTVQPESPVVDIDTPSADGAVTPTEAEADQLFSPDAANAEDEEYADESDSDDSDSRPNLEGSADETAEGFALNITPGAKASPHEETIHPLADSEETDPEETDPEQADAEQADAEELAPEADDEADEHDGADDEAESGKPSDDNFMDFLKNLDD